MSDATKCGHPACNCIPAHGEKYCSQLCKDAKNMTELACKCGHPNCRGEQLTT